MPQRPPVHRTPGWKPFALDEHRLSQKRDRDNAIYDGAWRRLRAKFLAANPVCCVPGCGFPATEADHIVSVRECLQRRLDWSNLRGMCKPHHSARTAREQGWGRS